MQMNRHKNIRIGAQRKNCNLRKKKKKLLRHGGWIKRMLDWRRREPESLISMRLNEAIATRLKTRRSIGKMILKRQR